MCQHGDGIDDIIIGELDMPILTVYAAAMWYLVVLTTARDWCWPLQRHWSSYLSAILTPYPNPIVDKTGHLAQQRQIIS